MHLAIVSPYPPTITGIGQYGYHVSRLLEQSGVFRQITVLTDSSKNPDQLEKPSSLQIERAWLPNQWNTGWNIRNKLIQLNPDLVWFNLGASVFGRSPLANLSGYFGPTWARQLNIPTIVTMHELVQLADLRTLEAPGGPFATWGARLLTHIGLQADVVCLTMRHYADWLATRQPNLPCVHIPIGAYHTPELLSENESNTRELLFFTTLAPYKGVELLLHAFSQLKAEYPDLHLTIAGSEHARFLGYAHRLHEQFNSLKDVRWLGQVPEDQVRELFRNAEIVALPYNASTGSSSVLYQAALWGRSLVASNLAEMQAVVCESGLDVTYFERGNAASLAKALKTQLDSPSLRRQQIQHNFSAIQHYSPEETLRAYLHAFNLAFETQSGTKRIVIPATLLTASETR